MPIRFLKVPGSDSLRTSRPTGYKFPTGLSLVLLGGLANTVVDYLIVAGGGGGGHDGGAGGGAGGFLTGSGQSVNASTSYTVTVGGGGNGSAAPGTSKGTNGSNSSITFSPSTLLAQGGGGGGSGGAPSANAGAV
jgi:hypothetical protein